MFQGVVNRIFWNLEYIFVPINASWQEKSWLAGCGKGWDCGTVHKINTNLFLHIPNDTSKAGDSPGISLEKNGHLLLRHFLLSKSVWQSSRVACQVLHANSKHVWTASIQLFWVALFWDSFVFSVVLFMTTSSMSRHFVPEVYSYFITGRRNLMPVIESLPWEWGLEGQLQVARFYQILK